MPTRSEIIKSTAAEIMAYNEHDGLDDDVLETLNVMAVYIEQDLERRQEALRHALAGRV